MVDNDTKSKGQYFTPEIIADFMVGLISFENSIQILEPSAGEGIFLKSIDKLSKHKITAIEIDKDLPNRSKHEIIYQDFFDFPITEYDVVIGNPPYIRWKHQSKDNRKLLLERSFWGKRMNGLTDMLQPFIFKSIDHLKSNGELIFITPKFWLQTLHSAPLRNFIIKNGHIDLIIDFNEKNIFPNSSLNLIIFKFVKNKQEKFTQFVKFSNKSKIQSNELLELKRILFDLKKLNKDQIISKETIKAFWAETPTHSETWYFIPLSEKRKIDLLELSCKYSPKVKCLINNRKQLLPLNILFSKNDLLLYNLNKDDCVKVSANSRKYYLQKRAKKLDYFYKSSLERKKEIERTIRLKDIAEIGNGMVSGLDKAFQIIDDNDFTLKEKSFVIDIIKSKSLKQYYSTGEKKYIFIEEGIIKSEKELKEELPNIYIILSPFKEMLMKRWTPHPLNWWEWAFPRNKQLFEKNNKKIFIPCKDRFDTRNHVRFAYEKGFYFAAQDVTVIIKDSWTRESYEYLLAYLNSDLIFNYLINKGLVRGGVLEFSEKPLSEIPIRLINWGKEEEIEIYNKITKVTKKIISSKSELTSKKFKTTLETLFRKLIHMNT